MKNIPFDERAFIWSLTKRATEVRRFSSFFKPAWLFTVELQPIYEEIISFTKEHGEAPSFVTIRDLLIRSKGEEVYESRYKPIIEELEEKSFDSSYIIHTLDLAKNAAITRSFHEMANSQQVLTIIREHDGKELTKHMDRWLRSFQGKSDDQHMSVEEAIKVLQESREFMPKNVFVKTGIPIIDKWCGGGARSPDLGLLVGVTGHGKTAALTYMAHNMAFIQELNVLLVSNELTVERNAERLLSRMTGVEMDKIKEDPIYGIASEPMKFIRQRNLLDKIRISYYGRDHSMNDIEADVSRFESVLGWSPDVILIDHMGRMKPNNVAGISRDNIHIYFGEIIKDISRAAKNRNNVTWAAVQTNRSGSTAQDLTLNMIQGSIQQEQEAVWIIGLHQPVNVDEGKQILQLKLMKARDSKNLNKSVKLIADFGTMNITEEEWEGPEDLDRSDDNDVPDSNDKKYKRKFRA